MLVVRQAELGELEHLVLLAVLRLDDDATAPKIARVLEKRAGREMSRGTLYAAFDRLEGRGLLTWQPTEAASARGGRKGRRFAVTPEGRTSLQAVRRVLVDMWDGVEDRLVGDRL